MGSCRDGEALICVDISVGGGGEGRGGGVGMFENIVAIPWLPIKNNTGPCSWIRSHFPPEPSLTQQSFTFSAILLGPHQYGLTASASISFEIWGNVTIQDRISDSSHSGRNHGCQKVAGS